jgi:hypothetical protein
MYLEDEEYYLVRGLIIYRPALHRSIARMMKSRNEISTPQMALVVDTICLHNFFPFLCSDALALGFVGYVCSKKFYLLFHPSSTHVRAFSQFLFCIFLLSPAELAWSRVIK